MATEETNRQEPGIDATGHEPDVDATGETSEPNQRDTSLAGLISTMLRDISSLIRNEVQLSKAEMSEKVSQAMAGLISLLTAGIVMHAGLLIVLAAAVFGLNTVLPPWTTPWLGALIIGVVVLIIGAIMLAKARNNLHARNLMPNRSMESLQRDQSMLQEHTRRQKTDQEKTQ